GMPLDGVQEFASLVNGSSRVALVGRHILLNEGGGDKPRVLRLYDPLTGEDVWKREFPGQALLLKTLDTNLTGCLTPDGKFEVLAVRTGETMFKGGIDADRVDSHIKGPDGKVVVTNPVLLADPDRFYLFLNREAGPQQPGRARVMVARGGFMNIRSIP